MEFTADGDSACGGCWCDGLPSGDAVASAVFLGDGVMKCVDDPDDTDDGPHLLFVWGMCVCVGCMPLVLALILYETTPFKPRTQRPLAAHTQLGGGNSTYIETSRIFLSVLGPRSDEPELHSLLITDVVGEADPMYGNPGAEKLPTVDDEVLDAFESLPGDGAASESRRNLLLLLIMICCGCWAGCVINWAKLNVAGLIGELDISAGGDAN